MKIYLDNKTGTRYQVYNKGYEVSNNTKYIYLIRLNLDLGNGPKFLQFSYDFFDTLILKGEFTITKKEL